MKRFSITIYLIIIMCSFCVGILSPYLRLSKGQSILGSISEDGTINGAISVETVFEDTEVSFLETKNGETIGVAKGRFSGWTSIIQSGFRNLGMEGTLNYLMKSSDEEVLPISIEKLEILAPNSQRAISTLKNKNLKVGKEKDKYCLFIEGEGEIIFTPVDRKIGQTSNELHRKGLLRFKIQGETTPIFYFVCDSTISNNQRKTAEARQINKNEKYISDQEKVPEVLDKLGLEANKTKNVETMVTQESIHEAARKGDLATIKKLVEQGADINETDKDGNTPLQVAAAKGYMEIVKFLTEYKANLKTQVKPEKRADVQVKPKDEKTVSGQVVLPDFKPTISGYVNNAFVETDRDEKERVVFWREDDPKYTLVAALGGTFCGGGFEVGRDGEKICFGETRLAIDGDTRWQFIGNLDYEESVYTFIGSVRLLKHTFSSNEKTPLVFKLVKDKGFVYVSGTGTVTTPEGKVIRLGTKEP